MSQVRPIEELFAELIQLDSAEQRDRFLDEVAANDPQLRSQLEKLFLSHQRAGSFLDEPEDALDTDPADVTASITGDPDTTLLENVSAKVGSGSLPHIQGYRIVDELARGGMGVVYRAHDQRLDRPVALKLMLKSEYATPADRIRFEREARATAKLAHQNIVTVYEYGYTNEMPFLAMEFVEGPTLQDKISASLPSSQETAQIVRDISVAIGYAHDNGIVHRDLKPANILLENAITPRVTDFGLARGETDRQLTATEAILGTPSYMAPEQAAGRMADVGRSSDVYALGAILYACLTGVPPFKGENHQLTLMKVLEAPLIPPSERNADVRRDLESICLKCLSRQAERRYSSANELVADLDRFLESRPVLARPRRLREKAESWIRRHVALLAVISALLLPGMVFIGLRSVSPVADVNQSRRHLQFLESVLQNDPSNSTAWLRHAEWRLEERAFDECLKDLTTAESLPYPDTQRIALLRSKALVGQKEYRKALEHAQLALSADVADPETHLVLGEIHLGLKKYQIAVNWLTKAIDFRPDYVAAYQQRAKAYDGLNDSDSARRDNRFTRQLLGESHDIDEQ